MTLTQREDLPHENTKGPNITLSRVDLVKNSLRCHPLKRQSSLYKYEDKKSFTLLSHLCEHLTNYTVCGDLCEQILLLI